METGGRASCRLLLEGREVPFISATMICEENAPKILTVNLVPLKIIKFIRPKTQVHFFVQNTVVFGDSDFHLAFDGEVTARGMGKEQDSRSFMIVATDTSGYWEEARAYYFNPNYALGKLGQITHGDQPIEQEAKFNTAITMSGSATSQSAMISEILGQGNKDIVVGMGRVLKKLSRANLFYRAAYDRLRIIERMHIYSSGKIGEFLKEISLEETLQNYVGKFGGMTSFRDLITSVMGLVFHNFVSVPFPARVPYIKPTQNTPGQAPKGDTIREFLFVPDGYSLPPPKCNVLFPNQQISFQFNDNFKDAPTRFSYRASLPMHMADKAQIPVYPMHYYPPSLDRYMFGKKVDRMRLVDENGQFAAAKDILGDGTDKSFKDVNYAKTGTDGKSAAIGGQSISNVLREADFLTNEEAIRGVFPMTETFMPFITSMASKTSDSAREQFVAAVGSYMFFKRRFAARGASAALMFNPRLVPGFNCLFLDSSEAGQSFIAKLKSATHLFTNSSMSTTVNLENARDFDEVDLLTGGSGEPPLPPWFDNTLFGTINKDLFDQETELLKAVFDDDDEVTEEAATRAQIKKPTVFPNISKFFQELLGCGAITDSVPSEDSAAAQNRGGKFVSIRGATYYLMQKFSQIEDSPTARDRFVADYTRRPTPNMEEAMAFLGAQPTSGEPTPSVSTMQLSMPKVEVVGKNVVDAPSTGVTDSFIKAPPGYKIPSEFATFEAVKKGPMKGRFDGLGYPDQVQLQIRREIIDKYVAYLKTRRGFNG